MMRSRWCILLVQCSLCTLLCTLLSAEAQVAVEEQQQFIRRLMQAQLPRLALQVWSDLDSQSDTFDEEQQFLHRSQEMSFLIGTLKVADNDVEREKRWLRCHKISQEMRLLKHENLSLDIDYALLRFALFEFSYEQNRREELAEQFQKLIIHLKSLFNQQSAKKGSVPVGAGRSFYLEQLQQSEHLRFCLAWSLYYLSDLSAVEDKRDLLKEARAQLEHFLDRPVNSILFVRALIAVCRIDEKLGDRIEAMYLLDDVESEMEKIPFELASKVWEEHIRLVETVRERTDLSLSLHTYITTSSENTEAWNALRFKLLTQCMELLKSANIYKTESLWSGMAQEHIDVLFEHGSSYAELCLPYIIRLAQFQKISKNFDILAQAEKYFEQGDYVKAVNAYNLALKNHDLRSNQRLFHLLNMKLYIAQKSSGSAEDAFQSLNHILDSITDPHLARFALRSWLTQAQVFLVANPQLIKDSYQKFFKLYKQQVDKPLTKMLYSSCLVATEAQQWFFVKPAMKTLEGSSTFKNELTLLRDYQACRQDGEEDAKRWVTNLRTFKQEARNVDAQTLEFLVFRYIDYKSSDDDVMMQQAALIREVRQESLLSNKQLRKLDFYLVRMYIDRQAFQFHEQLLRRVLAYAIDSDWELEAYISAAHYFDKLSRQRTGAIHAEMAIHFFEKCMTYMRPRFDDASIHTLRFAYANVLIRHKRINGALDLVKEFPPDIQRTWEIQLIYNQCLMAKKQYQQSLKNWRILSQSLPEGQDDWLLAKWYTAQCLYELGESEKSLKLIDYILLLYQQMPRAMRDRYQQLRTQVRE